MKYVVGLLALVIITALAASLVLGQDDEMTLKAVPKGENQRPLVLFNHAKHSDTLECVRCHHEYDKLMNNTGGDGGKCADCHQPSATAENSIPLTLAYHLQCKDCHARLLRAGAKTGPLTCGQCHPRSK